MAGCRLRMPPKQSQCQGLTRVGGVVANRRRWSSQRNFGSVRRSLRHRAGNLPVVVCQDFGGKKFRGCSPRRRIRISIRETVWQPSTSTLCRKPVTGLQPFHASRGRPDHQSNMNSIRHIQRVPSAPLRDSLLRNGISSARPATHARFLSSRATLSTSGSRISPSSPVSSHHVPLRSPFLPNTIQIESIAGVNARSFHASSRSSQKEPEDKDARARTEKVEEKEQKEESKDEDKKAEGEEGKEGEKSEAKKEKKEDLPPPPPHGDKTPWQVFLETMQTEFKQSQEWNESTKALASSAQEIAESESVKKARQAYEATSSVVSSTAGKVVKTTAGAIGKGAQWTWETPVVKGVRKGANITGEVLDKATKPIRETEAYQNVKNVIDDGSSSRYGGWVDKEERRRRREELEKQLGGKREVLQEDPE